MAFRVGALVSHFVLVVALAAVTGCEYVLPVNVPASDPVDRVALREVGGAVFYADPRVDDGYWVEVQRTRESGAVGGYVSNYAKHRRAIVLMFTGASTFEPLGSVEKVRGHHQSFAKIFRQFGYITWVVDTRECGTAYGQGDLADALEVIDWLNQGGKEVLDVDYVFVAGYSTGGTIATLVARNRKVDGVVALAPLTNPAQLEEMWDTFDGIANMFPQNTGMCQLRTTLDFYGPPGSPAWDAFDSVAHISEMQSPIFFAHGTSDIIYHVENTRAMEAQYQTWLGAGEILPPMEFMYIEGGDHFATPVNSEVLTAALTFFARYQW